MLNGLPAGSNQGAPGGQGQVSGNLQALASLPQFEMIRQAVQQDPNALPLILEQLATTSPEIYNVLHSLLSLSASTQKNSSNFCLEEKVNSMKNKKEKKAQKVKL